MPFAGQALVYKNGIQTPKGEWHHASRDMFKIRNFNGGPFLKYEGRIEIIKKAITVYFNGIKEIIQCIPELISVGHETFPQYIGPVIGEGHFQALPYQLFFRK